MLLLAILTSDLVSRYSAESLNMRSSTLSLLFAVGVAVGVGAVVDTVSAQLMDGSVVQEEYLSVDLGELSRSLGWNGMVMLIMVQPLFIPP